MEIFTDLLKSSPGLGVALLLVIFFLKHLSAKDLISNAQADKIEIIHTKAMETLEKLHTKTMEVVEKNTVMYGTIIEAIRKCQK